MQQISTAEFKNGMGLKIKDKIYTLVEFQHVKPGKGGAFVRYKLKDLRSGRVISDQTCNAGSKFDSVMLTTKEMQYLYNDGNHYYFMDMETYDQIPVPEEFIGDNAKWFKENDTCLLMYADEDLLTVQPPMFIEATITETDPGFKGDTVQGGSKPATKATPSTRLAARLTMVETTLFEMPIPETLSSLSAMEPSSLEKPPRHAPRPAVDVLMTRRGRRTCPRGCRS